MAIKFGIFLILVRGLFGCAAKPEADRPGSCSLNCSNAIVGANDPEFSIAIKTEEIKVQCAKGTTAGTRLDGAFIFHFLVTEKYKSVNDDDDDEDLERRRPVPFISFEPVILGTRDSEILAENRDATADGSVGPYKYAGIRTPKSQWCSDSCGVASIEILGVCPGPGDINTITVGLHSGALFSNNAVVTIETPDNDL